MDLEPVKIGGIGAVVGAVLIRLLDWTLKLSGQQDARNQFLWAELRKDLEIWKSKVEECEALLEAARARERIQAESLMRAEAKLEIVTSQRDALLERVAKYEADEIARRSRT